MNIPLFELNWDEDERREILEVVESGWVSMGPKTNEYEENLQKFYNVRFALSFNNGTSALLASYKAAGIKNEVVVPSLTFVATVNALVFLGIKPIFADIHSLEKPVVSPETIEKCITPKTTGVVFVNYAGFSTFVDDIREFCEERGLILVEDASHAHGAKYRGRFAGTWGTVGAFSTFANKNLSTGEGGYLITNDEKVYLKAKHFRSHGMTTSSWDRFREGKNKIYDVVDLGLNLRPSEIQSAIGIANLRKLGEENLKRQNLVKLYRKLISETLGDVIIPFHGEPVESSSHYIFPIILPPGIKRDRVSEKMAVKGIATSIHYPPVHKFSIYDGNTYLPNTEEYSRRTLTLPLWGNMGEEKVYRVVEALRECLYSQ